MSDKIYSLEEIRAISAPIAKAYGVAAMYLFGSYARGEAESHSDLDFRIEKGKLRGMWQLADMLSDLENQFGKPVDLITSSDAGFMQKIKKDEIKIYERDKEATLMYTFDEAYCLEEFRKLLEIDSTTGQFRQIQDFMREEITAMGYPCSEIHKGGLIADLGGEGDTLVLTAHLDDIGLMVRRINADGTLNVCPVGGLYPFYCMMDNVRVHTFDGKIITGTVCRTPNSIHVTEEELRVAEPDFRKNVCVVLDAPVHTAAETRALGIETGDYIGLEPRFTTSGGYIKSRFVDDKACVAVLMTAMKYLKDNGLTPKRHVLAYFATYEELGHGTSWLPEGVRDLVALDIAPTGPDQNSEEHKVSIFAKDSRFPYHSELTDELHRLAIDLGLDYVMDIFTPHYGSDGDTSIVAGHNIRHAAIGPGTANSHGYERTHVDGLRNTYLLTLGMMV